MLISPSEEINRIRRQLVLHSYLYYELNQTIWSDHVFDKQSKKLVDLQKEYGIVHGYKDLLFADWNGDTGFHLAKSVTGDEISQALRILRHHLENYGNEVVGRV